MEPTLKKVKLLGRQLKWLEAVQVVEDTFNELIEYIRWLEDRIKELERK